MSGTVPSPGALGTEASAKAGQSDLKASARWEWDGNLPGRVYVGGPHPLTLERSEAHTSHLDTTGSPVPRKETTCLFVPKARVTGAVLDQGPFFPSTGRQWGGGGGLRWEWSQSHLALGHADAQSKVDSVICSTRGPSPWAPIGVLATPSPPAPPHWI